MDMISNLKIVFVVGCQRTGTTLIGNILGAHPDAFLIDETNEVYPWIEAVFSGEDESRVNSLLKTCCQSARKNYREPDIKCDASGNLSTHVTHLILKTPNLTYSADKIAEFFPGQYCIFAYRDIRDVVVSMSKLDWIPMVKNQLGRIHKHPKLNNYYKEAISALENPLTQPHQARAYVGMIKTDLRKTFNHAEINKLEIAYESLVGQPDISRKKLFQHIQLPIDSLSPDHSQVMAGWGPGLTYRRGKINTFSIGQWKKYLTQQQERDIWKITESVMTELNYDRDSKEALPEHGWNSLNSNLKHQPIIATGRGGSGTRLLSILLQNFNIFLGEKTGGTEDSLEWVNLLYRIAIESNSGQIPSDDVRAHWRFLLRETAADTLDNGNWDGHQPWGWKLPETMMCLPEIFDAFGQCKLIHIIRHPVDTSLRRTHMTSRSNNVMGKTVLNAAYAQLGWDQKNMHSDPDYIRNAASWNYQVGNVALFGREVLGPQNYLEVRYEDICDNPARVSSSLAEFLGISPASEPIKIEIEQNRRSAWSLPDPRIDEVWDICREVALNLGYQAIDNRNN